MGFRLSYRDQSKDDEPLSKILFYSVIFHYVVFYILFGNPFLIATYRGGAAGDEGSDARNLDVQLLSPGQLGSDIQMAPDSEGDPVRSRAGLTPRDFPAFRPEEESPGETSDEIDRSEEAQSAPSPAPASPVEQGMSVVDAAAPESEPKKKAARKLPRNMTGPEDCLLKVVGMVCPTGEFQCIREYEEFCLSLPE